MLCVYFFFFLGFLLVFVRDPPDDASHFIQAAEGGHIAVVRTLVTEHHADVNVTNLEGATPLFIAAQLNRVAVVELLLQHGANPNVAKRDGANLFFSDLCDSTDVVLFVGTQELHLFTWLV
jgi:ankyrin repeat protein